MNRYSWLKFGLVPCIAWFFYWAIYFEIIILEKPIQIAFSTSYLNWILLFGLIGLEAIIIWREGKVKAKTLFAETQAKKDNPWAKPNKVQKQHKDSFRYFARRSKHAYSEKIESAFDSVWRSRVHKRLFFKIKRIVFGCLAILYFALALMSFSNPIYLVVFLITAYAFIENLLLAKHYQFIKRRVREDER